MGARHVLLNHFSQRYPKLPNLTLPRATNANGGAGVVPLENGVSPLAPAPTEVDADAEESAMNASPANVESSERVSVAEEATLVHASKSLPEPIVAISFDFMSVRVGDMYRVANYLEAIGELYKDDDEEGEEGEVVGGGVEGEKVKGKGQGKKGGGGGGGGGGEANVGGGGKKGKAKGNKDQGQGKGKGQGQSGKGANHQGNAEGTVNGVKRASEEVLEGGAKRSRSGDGDGVGAAGEAVERAVVDDANLGKDL